MNTVDIGPWSFEIPADWQQIENTNGVPYLESKDQTKGCYVKAITFGKTHQTAAEAAAFLQSVHERNYFTNPKAKWNAKERTASTTESIARSVLDLLDITTNYRVLSVVVATTHVAIQLTLHDYACKDYPASVRIFAPVVQSIRGPRGSA